MRCLILARDKVTLSWHVDDADAVYQMLMDAAGHKSNGQPADHGWYDDAKDIERQAAALRERRGELSRD